MSKFILIPQAALRFATSDLMLNVDNINTMLAREERDYPLIELNMGTKEVVHIRFNNLETRAHFFNFIIEACKPLSTSVLPEGVASKSEKKRRSHPREQVAD